MILDYFLKSNLVSVSLPVMHDHVHAVMEQWRREAPHFDRSPLAVVARISRLAQLIQLELERVFEAYGLNGGEFDVLASLRRSGPPYSLSPTSLSSSLIVTSGGMTKRLRMLERRGLVRRDPDPGDGRSMLVTLTPEGMRLVDEVVPVHWANEKRLLEGLPARDRAALGRLLEAFAVSLGDVALPGLERRCAGPRDRRY